MTALWLLIAMTVGVLVIVLAGQYDDWRRP